MVAVALPLRYVVVCWLLYTHTHTHTHTPKRSHTQKNSPKMVNPREKAGECGRRRGCLTSHQHSGLSQRRLRLDKCTCCHTEIELADQTCYLTQSQYADTGPTSPSTDPIAPGWPLERQLLSRWCDSARNKRSTSKAGTEPGSAAVSADALTLSAPRDL